MTFFKPKVLIFEMESEANTAVKSSILKRTKRLIDGHSLKQHEIADRLGVSFGAFRQWGRRTIPPAWYMKDFCDLMDCSVEYLLTGKEIRVGNNENNAMSVVNSYETLDVTERTKAKGFLQFLFDQEEKTQAPQKEKKTTKSSGR